MAASVELYLIALSTTAMSAGLFVALPPAAEPRGVDETADNDRVAAAMTRAASSIALAAASSTLLPLPPLLLTVEQSSVV